MKKFILLFLLTISYLLPAQETRDMMLANEYYNKGEWEKAKQLYADLVKNPSHIATIHSNYFDILLRTEDYQEAEKYLSIITKRFPDNIYYKLDKGLLLEKLKGGDAALSHYEQIIQLYKADNFRIRLVSDWLGAKQQYELAAKALNEARVAQKNPGLYALELANVYRMLNKKDRMVEEYLHFVNQNPNNIGYIKNILQNLLSRSDDLESLERMLIDKAQKEPDNMVYGELLMWVNLQLKNFHGAFIQARAMDRRQKKDGQQTLSIGQIALDNNDFEVAIRVFEYVIKEYPNTSSYFFARINLVKAREKQIKQSYPVAHEEVGKLVEQYERLIAEMGDSRYSHEALKNKAMLLAQYLDRKEEAVQDLHQLIANPRVQPELVGQAKLDLGDIYILKEEAWEATLLYSQVEKAHKDSPLAYEAKLKNGRYYYFKGDFQLAQEHLDILKEATSREIANDAMELSQRIKENIAFDSTERAMKTFAGIELLLFQNKVTEAEAAISRMFADFPNHSLTDDLLWLQADIQLKKGEFELAINSLQKLVDTFPEDVLADDAWFMMAEIYERQLGNSKKAMDLYFEFLSRFAGSMYQAEARKRYRNLRGDFRDIQ
jgi:tetratricopeptide (TPR) repeat protein